MTTKLIPPYPMTPTRDSLCPVCGDTIDAYTGALVCPLCGVLTHVDDCYDQHETDKHPLQAAVRAAEK